MSFKKFTSIGKFSDAWYQMQRQEINEIEFRGKIKLHGTNAAIRVQDGEIFFQKRTADVTIGKDNAGFASFASDVKWSTSRDYIIYGEWAGQGVQKSDAISLIGKKMFFVFGVQVGDIMITEPDMILDYMPDDERVTVLPWFHSESTSVRLDTVNQTRAFAELLDLQVKSIGNEDPYVKDMFGISGVGEGLVVTPTSTENGFVPIELFNTYSFKVKSEAHLVQKTKGPNSSIYVEIPGSVNDFVEQFVTDNRCEQMVAEHLNGDYAMQGISTFLKVLTEDIIKESKNEFAEMNVDWKFISKQISKQGVQWFKSQHKV